MRSFVLLGASGLLTAADPVIVADHRDGRYAVGDTVTWTISGMADDTAPAYSVKAGGRTLMSQGTLHPVNGTATVQAQFTTANTILLTVATGDKSQVYGGAVADWSHIAPAVPTPKDFDAFWTAKIADLKTVPADPVLEAVPSDDAQVDLWKISMGNIGGSRIHGYVARPKGDVPCPAQLVVQWAGVYPLEKSWAVGQAKNGWLTLNLLAHDLPVDREKAFYDELKAGALKDYSHLGANDREQSYFLRMYLSCYRAADYLATRSDWNHRTFLVSGGSQGGLQAIVTAGLHPAITVATANVPAGCDHGGGVVGRSPGWPNWVAGTTGTEADARQQAAAYYDVVNFAARVKAPVLVGVGLIDTTCPPAGILAAFNQLGGPKRLVIMPTADHMKVHDAFYTVRNAWFMAARDGKPLPLE